MQSEHEKYRKIRIIVSNYKVFSGLRLKFSKVCGIIVKRLNYLTTEVRHERS